MDMTEWQHLIYPFQRDAAWGGWERTFIQPNGRGEKPQVWKCKVEDGRMTTTWSQLDGKEQTTTFVGKAKNLGRSNAITAAQDCLNEARRECRKKWDFEGYREVFNELELHAIAETVLSVRDLLTNLPGSFCVCKPNGDPSKRMVKLADQGRVLFTHKRDGLAYWVVIGPSREVMFYSRRSRLYHDKEGPTEKLDEHGLVTLDYSTAVPWAARFPHLVEEIQRLNLPPYSMLAGELVCSSEPFGLDDFRRACSYTKSLTPQSLEDQKRLGLPWFYVWEMPFYDGQDLIATMPAKKRLEYLRSLFSWAAEHGGPLSYWVPIHWEEFPNIAAAEEAAKLRKMEGFVIIDPNAVYGDKAWSLRGKPDRPEGSAKVKPRGEGDFICEFDPDNDVGEWGTGKHERHKSVTLPSGEVVAHGGVGALGLYQYNSAGEKIYISKCSSGMDYETQAKLQPGRDFPFVAQIEFLSRTYISDGEKTNALRHPTYLRRRDDKAPEECTNERL